MDRRIVTDRLWIAGLLLLALAGTGCGGSISTPDSYSSNQSNTGSGGGSSTGGGSGGGGSTPPPSGGGTTPPPPVVGSGAITVAWDSPSAEANQSCPQSLSGYKVYMGSAAGAYTNSETVPINALTCSTNGQTGTCGAIETCSYRVQGLTNGTWYFAVTAYDASGNESVFSNTVSAAISY